MGDPDFLLRGGCLCGGVRYELRAPFRRANFCHCARCRKHSGGAALAQGRAPASAFTLRQGGELLVSFTEPGHMAKVFCSRCGSSLFGGTWPDGPEVSIRLGTLDDDPRIQPGYHSFAADVPPWDRLPDDGLPRYSGRAAPDAPPSFSLAQRIYRTAHLTGTFRLRSGAVSDEYFDKYRFESDPELLGEIADRMVGLIPPGTDALAGLELGGVPLATALALRTGLPALFVRKQAKEYGTGRLAEGGEIAGRRLTIVEDVVTSGGQVATSSRQLRELGATVEVALCVIDRQAGGAESLAAAALQLRPLFTREQLEPVR